MKVCIVSDSHDRIELLHTAVEDAKKRGAEAILHCGDIVAPYTLKKLHTFGLPMHAIHGNNQGDLAELCRLSRDPKHQLTYYGRDATLELGGKKIFLVHFPHYAEAMALTGKYDLVCCGHNHRTRIDTIKNMQSSETWLVNPGSSSGMDNIPPTYAFGDLETMEFSIINIADRTTRQFPEEN